MSQATIEDMQNDLAALRRDFDGLRAQLVKSTLAEQEPIKSASDDIAQQLKRSLTEKEKTSGLAVGSLITQIRGKSGSGTAYSVITLTEAGDLPTEENIAEKIARLSVFVQNPLIFRALRCLAEPFFDALPMRRRKADLAADLGVDEAEIETALTPLLDQDNLRWGKDSTGQEYYEWDGNGFAMMLLIHG